VNISFKPVPMVLLAGISPVAHAARSQFLDAEFLHTRHPGLNQPALDLPRPQGGAPLRSDIYRDLWLPRKVLIHPDAIQEGRRHGALAHPRALVNISFPQDYFEVLPQELLNRILQWGIPYDRVDISCVIQDMPWAVTLDQAAGQPGMMLKPNYWAHQDAPRQGVYSASVQAQASLFEAPAGVGFQGYADGAMAATTVRTHSPLDGQGQPTRGRVRPSPGGLQIRGLDVRVSTSFWSLVRVGDRVAATLHGLLNDDDAEQFDDFAPGLRTFHDLIQGMDGKDSGLAGSSLARQLRRLVRPMAPGGNLLDELAPSRPSLWTVGADQQLEGDPAEGGQRSRTQTVPCAPGATLAGSCRVQGGAPGQMQIGIRFLDDQGAQIPSQVGSLMPTMPEHAFGQGVLRNTLGVLGVAPPGNTQAQLYVLTSDDKAGAARSFRGITFKQLPEPPAPAEPVLWPYRNVTLTDPMQGGEAYLARYLDTAFGQRLAGRCRVRAEGFDADSSARIGIRYDTGEHTPVLGWAMAPEPGRADRSADARWAVLEVLGSAPEGATRAVPFIAVEGNPGLGAYAHFEGVEFRLLPAPARPNLWPYGSSTTLTDPGQGDVGIKAKAFGDIQAGEGFTGECLVRTGFTTGQAQLGIQFDSGDGTPVLARGEAMGPELPDRTGAAGPVRLGVQGQVPPGATRALVYVLVEGEADGGAQAVFEHVAFHRLPAGSPLRPNLWPHGSAVTLTDPGQGGLDVKAKAIENCRGGERFAGGCFVWTEGFDGGDARIGIQFDSGDGTPVLGKAEPAAPLAASSAAPGLVPLGVEGVVPPGATRALMYVIVQGSHAPGARAHFEHLAFSQVLEVAH
jgi:hypothetical protein